MNSKILFQGSFSAQDVTCKFHKVSSRKIDPGIEEKTKQIWQQKLKEAKKQGKKIWDQPVYRLERFQVDGNVCQLELSTIPFSIRSSIKEFTDDLAKKGEEYLPMAIYSSIFIETADHDFVFGEKSDKYVTNRKYSYIGGVFNKSADKNDKNLFAAASDEIKEELGIEDKDVEEIRLFGALRTESGNLALVLYCQLKLTKNEVIKKFEKRNELEMENLFFAKKDEVRSVAENKIGKELEFVDIFEQSSNE